MARSMTGYGSSSFLMGGIGYTLEIHSVNRKTLEINMQLPRELLSVDLELRSQIGERLKRGQVTCRLSKKDKAYIPDKAALKRIKKEWDALASELGMNEQITFSFLVEQAGKITQIEKLDQKALKSALDDALDHLIRMQNAEGAALVKEMEGHVLAMETRLRELQGLSQTSLESYKVKLGKRLESLQVDVKSERIALETVLFAEKIDITEELERLGSHLAQVKAAILDEVVGKKLDFLLQEMHREVNTIMSKSGALEIINHGVFLKGEVDKLREQARNIE